MIRGKDVLLTEQKGHIYVMTVNREERRNAMSSELMDRMAQEWEYFNENDDLWVAIFTGAGDVAFSSGHDLKEDVEGDVRGGEFRSHKPYVGRRASADVATYKPTIAAINGYCLAGGWFLAQECDVPDLCRPCHVRYPRGEMEPAGGLRGAPRILDVLRHRRRDAPLGSADHGRPRVPDRVRQQGGAERAAHGRVHGVGRIHVHPRPAIRPRPQADALSRPQHVDERAHGAGPGPLRIGTRPKPGVHIDATEGPRAFAEKREAKYD